MSASPHFKEIFKAMAQNPAAGKNQFTDKIQAFKNGLIGNFTEREVESLALLAGLFANEPTILFGTYGIAKTNMVDVMARLMDFDEVENAKEKAEIRSNLTKAANSLGAAPEIERFLTKFLKKSFTSLPKAQKYLPALEQLENRNTLLKKELTEVRKTLESAAKDPELDSEYRRYFRYLLHPFAVPDELLGAVDIRAYKEEGVYKRSQKGGMMEAYIIFLDEPFKSSDAVRNTLLDIILNKIVRNGDEIVKLPMIGLFMAANEVPDTENTTTGAFYDRTTVRVFVDPVSREFRHDLLRKAAELELTKDRKAVKQISVEDIRAIQAETKRRWVEATKDDALMKQYLDFWDSLEQHFAATYADASQMSSDRTMGAKLLKNAAAVSLILNEPKITTEHIAVAAYFAVPRIRDEVQMVEDAIKDSGLIKAYDYVFNMYNICAEIYNGISTVAENMLNKEDEALLSALSDLKKTISDEKTTSVLKYLKENQRYSLYAKHMAKAVKDAEGSVAAADGPAREAEKRIAAKAATASLERTDEKKEAVPEKMKNTG